jgi:hypothetical protein
VHFVGERGDDWVQFNGGKAVELVNKGFASLVSLHTRIYDL